MNLEVVKPLTVGGSKQVHGPSSHSTVPAPEPHTEVRVHIGEPPKYLFSISGWEAADRVRRGEARVIKIGKRRRGIQIVPKTTASQEHTLHAQLSELQQTIQDEHPELWVINGGLATLDQVEGLPVVGQAIKAFTIGGGPFKPRAPRLRRIIPNKAA